MNEDDEETLLIRKTSQDKLTYKNTIQNRINWCLIVMGKTNLFPNAVKALEHSIIFDVQGYKFKSNLEKIHNDAHEMMMENEKKAKNKLGRAFYKRSVKAKFKIRQEEDYWIYIFDEVMQLIADHKLLIEYDKSISIRKAGDEE